MNHDHSSVYNHHDPDADNADQDAGSHSVHPSGVAPPLDPEDDKVIILVLGFLKGHKLRKVITRQGPLIVEFIVSRQMAADRTALELLALHKLSNAEEHGPEAP